MKLILAAVFSLALMPIMALAQDLDEGFVAAQAGDYASALREWMPLAQQGNASAQFNLGFCPSSEILGQLAA
jgi:TPR repeat protein